MLRRRRRRIRKARSTRANGRVRMRSLTKRSENRSALKGRRKKRVKDPSLQRKKGQRVRNQEVKKRGRCGALEVFRRLWMILPSKKKKLALPLQRWTLGSTSTMRRVEAAGAVEAVDLEVEVGLSPAFWMISGTSLRQKPRRTY